MKIIAKSTESSIAQIKPSKHGKQSIVGRVQLFSDNSHTLLSAAYFVFIRSMWSC